MASTPKVRFKPALAASAVHASIVVATGGECSDQKLESALIRPTTEINTRLASVSVDIGVFWEQLFAEVLGGQNIRDACSPALLAARCNVLQVEQTSAAIASRLDESRLAFQSRYPKLKDQLELRSGPLKERWQTFGPGLLIQVTKAIWGSSAPKVWWPSQVDAFLVQPIRGGDGGSVAPADSVWIEAMLTDADPSVSELFRLAYWVTRVAIDRHLEAATGGPPSDPDDTGSTVRSQTLPWDLGIVPVVLEAGEELELLRQPRDVVASAIRMWRLGDDNVADIVMNWWNQWADAGAAMPVALKALDRMLEPLREKALRASTPTEGLDRSLGPDGMLG